MTNITKGSETASEGRKGMGKVRAELKKSGKAVLTTVEGRRETRRPKTGKQEEAMKAVTDPPKSTYEEIVEAKTKEAKDLAYQSGYKLAYKIGYADGFRDGKKHQKAQRSV